MMPIDVDRWYYSPDHRQLCQVIETQTLWGETICRVWLPGSDTVVRIPAAKLKPLESASIGTAEHIVYIAAAAKVADALTHDVLLAPIESSVIPLPHQIRALSRAMSEDRVRYLLADEVGLGKTIEAGLIMRELKLRGLVKRTLVIAPKGLVSQWVAEMKTHFNEQFQLVLPEDLKTLNRIASVANSDVQMSKIEPSHSASQNPWTLFPQIVVPMDSVKPLDKRRGWNATQIREYNQARFEDLISASWDLIIVDEAHRLGGSTDQVARFKLGQGLAEAAPYLLLLSATPHQGKTDAFYRLVSLIDSQAFPDISSVTRERVQPYVIRTEKRHAIDAAGQPLFKPRKTQLATVSWEERHRNQQLLYEAVTEYVREGYNQAIKEKRNYIGFLMILMQRLVVSSTNAIKTALERRLSVLNAESNGPSLFDELDNEDTGIETYYDLDGQEQLDVMLSARIKALKNERNAVKLLLDLASRCEQLGPDAKAEALLAWFYRLQAEENDSELKFLIFTEFVPTQEMLRQFLTERGFSVVCLNGSMDMEERKHVQEAFAKDVRILISTDAGGEGLNLQFCHVVINYDIPWNPMRLEQRIGRVDRIGQTHIVRAINFVFEDSVEHRVREVLEENLAIIFEEFGIDKTSDVLDSAQAGHMFDEMYVESILNPDKVETSVEKVLTSLEEQVREARTTASLLAVNEPIEPDEAQRLQSHPLPYWVESMTVNYLKAYGGKAEKKNQSWFLTWPDGEIYDNVVFTSKESEKLPAARQLTMEDPKVRELTRQFPRFVPGQPVPIVSIPGLSPEVIGYWSLWQISIVSYESQIIHRQDGQIILLPGHEIKHTRILPIFRADNGNVYMPTARHIWDQLLTANTQINSFLAESASQNTFYKLQATAEEYGKSLFEALLQDHQHRISREREKANYAFNARRKIIQQLGLPQVRKYRLNQLELEEYSYNEQLKQKAHAFPDMVPLILIRIEGGRNE